MVKKLACQQTLYRFVPYFIPHILQINILWAINANFMIDLPLHTHHCTTSFDSIIFVSLIFWVVILDFLSFVT